MSVGISICASSWRSSCSVYRTAPPPCEEAPPPRQSSHSRPARHVPAEEPEIGPSSPHVLTWLARVALGYKMTVMVLSSWLLCDTRWSGTSPALQLTRKCSGFLEDSGFFGFFLAFQNCFRNTPSSTSTSAYVRGGGDFSTRSN